MLPLSEETQRVGLEVQKYLAASGMTRYDLSRAIGRSKSLVDKLCSGRYTEKTISIVLARTKFVRSNAYASEELGRYTKASWSTYIGEFLRIEYAFPQSENNELWVDRVSVGWDEDLPGLRLSEPEGQGGVFAIPHERSPLVYIEPPRGKYGAYSVLTTMVGEKAMRGLKLTVNRIVANAFLPVITPVILSREHDLNAFAGQETIVREDHRYSKLKADLDRVVSERYGVVLGMAHAA